jgi:regulator of cell morphogenesis and NO signaling
VEEIYTEMMSHMDKEENILFPYIKQLQEAIQNKNIAQSPLFDTVQNPIKVMEDEHELVGSHLARIRELTDNYTLPQDACASYSLLYRMLDEFEEDLHLHVHLENNILFPKTLEMEKQLNS